MPDEPAKTPAVAQSIPSAGPVLPNERLEIIDVLRGFALFGVLLANMSDALPWSFLFEERWSEAADQAVMQFLELFVTGRFLRLFSFLFGLGFALQMQRAESRGVRFVPRYVRRLGVLLAIGIAHYLVGWTDILHAYAVLGFLLLLLRGLSLRAVLIVAFACLLIHPAYEFAADSKQAAPESSKADTTYQESMRIHTQGSLAEILGHNARDFVHYLASPYPLIWWLGGIFPVFLLGFYAGRRRIFENVRANLTAVHSVLWWGLGIGLLGMGANLAAKHPLVNSTLPFLTQELAGLLWTFGAPALCLFYAAAVTLAYLHAGSRVWTAPLAAVGRMALSNYLLQTLFAVLIFYRFGLGLYGQVGPLQGALLACLIFPVQVLLSVWWLRHFRFGPVEWLWRTLTYGKLQPMRF